MIYINVLLIKKKDIILFCSILSKKSNFINLRYIYFCLVVCSYHVTYAFYSESTLCNCFNVKEQLAKNRCDIWGLSDRNENRTKNHLVKKRTLNHLAKLAKLLSCENLSVKCIWLYVLIMSRTRFRVNVRSIVAWMSRNSRHDI